LAEVELSSSTGFGKQESWAEGDNNGTLQTIDIHIAHHSVIHSFHPSGQTLETKNPPGRTQLTRSSSYSFSPPRAMTEPVLGSSLLQTQDTTHHSATHNHHNHARSHQHTHQHTHQQRQQQQQQEQLHRRQDASTGSIIQIVQTVSVVQIIDATGSTVAFSTQPLELPTTTTIAAETQSDSAFVAENEPDVNVVVSSAVNDVTDAISSILPTTALSIDVDTSLASSMPSSFPTIESFAQITSTHLSGSASTYPTFTGVITNTTSTQGTYPDACKTWMH
jgi:hypothetical protein